MTGYFKLAAFSYILSIVNYQNANRRCQKNFLNFREEGLHNEVSFSKKKKHYEELNQVDQKR